MGRTKQGVNLGGWHGLLQPLFLAVVAATAAGCGPSLEQVNGAPTWLAADRRCAQGPFEIRLQTLGTRWGEGIRADLYGRRAVFARYELWVDGKRRGHGRIRTSGLVPNTSARKGAPSRVWRRDREPDNARCVERPGERVDLAAGAPAPTRDPGPGPASTAPPDPPPAHPDARPRGPAPAEAPVVPPAPRPPPPAPIHRPPVGPALGPVGPSRLVVVETPAPRDAPHRARFLRWRHSDPRLEGAQPLAKGRPVVLRIWAETPQDWEGARVKLWQFGLQPDVPEAEWVAHLEAEREERKRERAERLREARERRAKSRKAWRAKSKERAARRAFCASHRDDEGCWGKGGYAGHVRRAKARRAAYLKRRAAWRAERARRRAEQATRPQPPKGPPPMAKTEDPGPTPSTHARWVAGFWQWSGTTWIWLSGWWRVPEEDLRLQRTAVAPTAPPPARVEAIPEAPCYGAVWLPGHWVWRARTWVWLVGRWTLPPNWRSGVQVRWRTPRWIEFRGGVRLLPGRWLRGARRPAGASPRPR